MSRQGEAKTPTSKNIKEFWEAEASEWGDSPRVTIRDHYFRLHELHTLLTLLPKAKQMLDVGCGTGFGTTILSRRAERTLGADYSDNMIRWANRLLADADYRDRIASSLSPLWPVAPPPEGQLTFAVGNILDLSLPLGDFDVITGQRILINLPTHEEQLQALAQLRKAARAGALLVLVEATRQGHRRTDEYRRELGLPALEKYWHNQYVDTSRMSDWTRAGWAVDHVLHFDTYALLSKVIYPAAVGPDECQFLSGANAAAMEIAAIFRTKAATQEVGVERMLRMWTDRARRYDEDEASKLETWVRTNASSLADWTDLGHQELFVARAV